MHHGHDHSSHDHVHPHEHHHHHDEHHHDHKHDFEKQTDCTVEAYFNHVAQHNSLNDFTHDELHKLEVMFKKWDIKTGQQILEPGCGQGRLTELLAQRVEPQGKVWACDLSGHMTAMAMSRLVGCGMLDRVEFFHGSVLDMTLPVGTLDLALLFNVFSYFTDKNAVLSLCARTLVPGGVLWINNLKSEKTYTLLDSKATCHMPTVSEMKVLIEQAGLTFIEYEDDHGFYSLRAVKKN